MSHGREGFHLHVRDEWLGFLAAESAINLLMTAIGHPCCGRGAWFGGKGKLGDLVDLGWFKLLNAPNGLYKYGHTVIELPLTFEHAFTLQPNWRDEEWVTIDGEDEISNIWRDGVLVEDRIAAE